MMAKIDLYVKDSTKKLYFDKFYEAKARDHALTHDQFLRSLMGLR